jgi:hypothetical protein
MKAYRESESMAPLILNFSAEVESSKPRPRRLPTQETNPGPTAQEAGRADSRCGHFAEEINLIPLPGLIYVPNYAMIKQRSRIQVGSCCSFSAATHLEACSVRVTQHSARCKQHRGEDLKTM